MFKILLFVLLFSFTFGKNHYKRVHQNITRHLQSSLGVTSSSNVYRYEPIHLLEEPPIGTLLID